MAFDIWRAQNQLVFDAFLPELASHLERSIEDVQRTGILQSEFPYQRVRVCYGDDRQFPDSVWDFGYAFALISLTREAVAVFAQHAGYFVFNHCCIVTIRESYQLTDEKVIWDVADWWRHREV
ncbi:MAG: hypothetical protein V4669_04825 [Pseudomonadota bacterium]